MKAKKSSKKSSGFTAFDPLETTRAFIGLFIIMLAASIFMLFKTYQQNIMQNHLFYQFIILTFIGMALLISLLFLINPSHKGKK